MPAPTVPTDITPARRPTTGPVFDLDDAWTVHAQVSIRPERFGALLYHFGTRRLSFLKDPKLLAVLQALPNAPSARLACQQSGVSAAELPSYRAALTTLAGSQMIVTQPGVERTLP